MVCWINILRKESKKIKTSFLLHHYTNFCTFFTTDLDELRKYSTIEADNELKKMEIEF